MAKDRKQVSAQQRRLLQQTSAAYTNDEEAIKELGEDEVWCTAGGGEEVWGSAASEEAAMQQPRRCWQRETVAVSAPVRVPTRWGEEEEEEREYEESEYEGETKMPPHEYLSMVERSRGTGSVLEGSGRTLKGRDMRRLRDAVWNQTGFFG